jgi:hypothetical protein
MPALDPPRPLMNRGILGASAAWADVGYFAIERCVIPPDPVGQGVFLRSDLADSSNLVTACRQIELLIVLVDLLEVILGRLQVILAWLPMTDRSLHRSIVAGVFGVGSALAQYPQRPLTPTASSFQRKASA